jgi:chromosome segregation ATPase
MLFVADISPQSSPSPEPPRKSKLPDRTLAYLSVFGSAIAIVGIIAAAAAITDLRSEVERSSQDSAGLRENVKQYQDQAKDLESKLDTAQTQNSTGKIQLSNLQALYEQEQSSFEDSKTEADSKYNRLKTEYQNRVKNLESRLDTAQAQNSASQKQLSNLQTQFEQEEKSLENFKTETASKYNTLETEFGAAKDKQAQDLKDLQNQADKRVSDVQSELDSDRKKLAGYADKEQTQTAEVAQIEVQGGIYRVPQEPTVWLVRGGRRYRVRSDDELYALTGQNSGRAIVTEAILRIPIEPGSEQ